MLQGSPTVGEGASLRDHLAVVRRRKLLILQALVLVPAAAVAFSLRQEPLYEGSAEVLLSRQNLAAALTGTPDPTAPLQADRVAETQARLARVPEVARRVLEAERVRGRTAREFLQRAHVSTAANADILTFTVTDRSAAVALRLATAYAREFVEYRSELDTAALERARAEVLRRMRELDVAGERSSELYATLADKEQQLSTLEALQTSNAFVVREAEEAPKVSPKPVRNGILGVLLGVVLGLGIAFLREALDTRVRSANEIADRLGLPLLARLPAPPKRTRKNDRLVMLADPAGTHAEAFRMLRTNLEFVRLERDVKTIMVTSAVEQEGKSTTVANLAVAFARAGQRVILVDLDLRRPYLDKFFKVRGRPGLTQLALGQATLREALVSINVGTSDGGRERRGDMSPSLMSNGNSGKSQGLMAILRAGPIPPDPGEFMATQKLGEILAMLRESADIVLIDAPPMLHVGDAMALSGKVDAMVVVTRMDVVRRPLLNELRRLLDGAPATKLGFVVTAADVEDSYGYSSTYGYLPRAYEPTEARRETVP